MKISKKTSIRLEKFYNNSQFEKYIKKLNLKCINFETFSMILGLLKLESFTDNEV